MKTIAVLNYKGGVGKTTFTISVSQALALIGFRVLAIDNDSQHNLSLLLGEKIIYPNIRDIYRSTIGNAAQYLSKAITRTKIANLDLVTSHNLLCTQDIKDPFILDKVIKFSSLEKFYDFIIIDNSPGIDIIQEASLHAADELFVPTELSYFGMNGLSEMSKILADRYRDDCMISKIIPNFYKNTKSQNEYLDQLRATYSDKVTKTTIPYDTTFDMCMKDGKTLFLNRLYSKAAAYYLKLVHELFDLDEDDAWEKVLEERNKKLSEEARTRFFKNLQMKNSLMNSEHTETES